MTEVLMLIILFCNNVGGSYTFKHEREVCIREVFECTKKNALMDPTECFIREPSK